MIYMCLDACTAGTSRLHWTKQRQAPRLCRAKHSSGARTGNADSSTDTRHGDLCAAEAAAALPTHPAAAMIARQGCRCRWADACMLLQGPVLAALHLPLVRSCNQGQSSTPVGAHPAARATGPAAAPVPARCKRPAPHAQGCPGLAPAQPCSAAGMLSPPPLGPGLSWQHRWLQGPGLVYDVPWLAEAGLLRQLMRLAGRWPVAAVAGQQACAVRWCAWTWSCPQALQCDSPSITLPKRSWATAES